MENMQNTTELNTLKSMSNTLQQLASKDTETKGVKIYCYINDADLQDTGILLLLF